MLPKSKSMGPSNDFNRSTGYKRDSLIPMLLKGLEPAVRLSQKSPRKANWSVHRACCNGHRFGGSINGQLFGQEEFVHCRIYDLSQSAPTIEISFAHPLLDRGQHPIGGSFIVSIFSA